METKKSPKGLASRPIASLLEKKLIRKEKLYVKHHQQEYESPWWNPKNQTCYYSVNYEELERLIETTESTGNIRFEEYTKLRIEEIKETKVCELSRNKTKNTNYRKLTNKQDYSDRTSNKSESIAAANSQVSLEGKESHKSSNSSLSRSYLLLLVKKRQELEPNTIKP